MRLKATGRREGKTSALLDAIACTQRGEAVTLIVHNADEAKRVHTELKKRFGDAKGLEVVTAGQVAQGGLRGRHATVMIDNLDLVLPALIGLPVTHATATVEEWKNGR